MEKGTDSTNNFRSTFAQFLAAMGFSITNGNIGLILAMPTIVIGALRKPDSILGLSENQASWFGSLLFITQPSGSLVSGFLQNRFGRKKCLMLINLPQLASWLILYHASTVTHLFVAVSMMGLSVGFLEAPLLSYVGEVTQPRLRGVFSCFAGIFYNVGFMIGGFLGATLPWRSMVLYSAFSPVLAFMIMAMLPESPAWLVTKGRVKDAERAYQWLRGWVPPEAVKEELDTIVRYVRETHGHSKYFRDAEYELVIGQQEPRLRASSAGWRVLLEPEVLTAFRIILLYFAITSCATLIAIRPFFIELLETFNSSVEPLTVVVRLSLGFMEAPVLSYIGEISEPRLRGVFNTLGGIFFNIGLLVLNSIGAATNWRTLALICAASPVVAFLALALIPESPAWLVSKGRVKDAERAYQWLRGWAPPEAVREELHALVAYVRQSHAPRIVNSHEYKVAGIDEGSVAVSREHESKLKALLHPSVLRPLRLIVAYFFIAACASLCALKPFIIDFMTKLDLPIKPHLVLVYCSVLVILGSLTSTLLMRRIGKRGLTFWSFGLALPCCFGLGLYIHFDLHLPWLALAFICVSSYAPPLGMIPIPWFLISEVFPLKSRGMASGVAAALGYLILFLVIKTYFSIVSLVGVPGSFILYGAVGLLGMVYLYFRLPETEGVTLQDVERIFHEDNSMLVNSDNQNINDKDSEQIPV